MPCATEMLSHDEATAWLRRNGVPTMTSSKLYRLNCKGTGPRRWRCGAHANGYLPADLADWVATGAGVRARPVANLLTMTVAAERPRERPRPIRQEVDAR